MMRSRRLLAWVGLLLVTSALTGCLQEDAPSSSTTDGSDGDPGDDGSDTGTGGGDTTPSEGYAALEEAFAGVSGTAADAPERIGVSFLAESRNDSASGPLFEMKALVDSSEGFFVATMGGESFADDGGSEGMNPMAAFGEGTFIVGQAWKTTFFGTETNLVTMYNESAEPPQNAGDASFTPGESGGEGFSDFLGVLAELEEEDVESVKSVTFNGEPALELVVSRVDGNVTTKGTVIVYTNDPPRPARIQVDVHDPDAENEWEKDAVMTIEFVYGAAASHDLEDDLKRLETLAFTNAEEAEAAFMGSSFGQSQRNWTIQPSHFASHRLALDGVEAHATKRSEDGSPGDASAPDLVLPLEDGSAENEDVRVTFTDADGDGKVSPGDEIVLEALNDNGSRYAVALLDEESGIRVVPVPGVALTLGALALVGFAFTRRRR